MTFPRLYISLLAIVISSVCLSMAQRTTKHVHKPWSERIAQSFLHMHPDSINYSNEAKSRKWNYEQGLMLDAMYHMWQQSGDSQYVRYIRRNLDYYIQPDGVIRTYNFDEFQLDNIASGKAVLHMYELTHNVNYRRASDILRQQLALQPRTGDGGFWHKKIYPNQMWLDGLYMAEPFYTFYSAMFHDSSGFDDVARQFILIAHHCYDEKTGLYFHGWDESCQERWANQKSGCSPSLWGRSLGWFAMALVDVLEYFPQDHPMRSELVKILNSFALNMLQQRDEKTKLWYQVVNRPDEKGNYLEASVSAMVTYAFAKGANRGYLPGEFRIRAEETFKGILDHLIFFDTSGFVHLEHVCSVGGLGGNPYRDGSIEYYLSEPQRTDDFKGLGPFLLAVIELEKPKISDK